ncbi:MAG: hypothetical protein M0C28_39055 [Candidatus Moduliflexus flocculans]|nr:hypothetical protein [Candidatus Moduliflexus flocculans]
MTVKRDGAPSRLGRAAPASPPGRGSGSTGRNRGRPADPVLYDVEVSLAREGEDDRRRHELRRACARSPWARTARASAAWSSTASRSSSSARSTRAAGRTASTRRRPTRPCVTTSRRPRSSGMNMARKHVKVEPDRLVLLVRQARPARLAGHAERRLFKRRRPGSRPGGPRTPSSRRELEGA